MSDSPFGIGTKTFATIAAKATDNLIKKVIIALR